MVKQCFPETLITDNILVVKSYEEVVSYFTYLANIMSEKYGDLGLFIDPNALASSSLDEFNDISPESFFEENLLILVFCKTSGSHNAPAVESVNYEN